MLKPFAFWPKTFWNHVAPINALQSICSWCKRWQSAWWCSWWCFASRIWRPWLQPVPFELYDTGGREEKEWVLQICSVSLFFVGPIIAIYSLLPLPTSLLTLFRIFLCTHQRILFQNDQAETSTPRGLPIHTALLTSPLVRVFLFSVICKTVNFEGFNLDMFSNYSLFWILVVYNI